VQLRIPPDLLAQIDRQIESCNRTRREEPYTRSSFIIASLVERFEKYGRARKAAKKRKPMTAEELQAAAAAVPTDGPPEQRMEELGALIDSYFAP